MRHVATGVMVDAHPLSDMSAEARQSLGVEDARKHHIGIFHVRTGQLLNTMEPEQFELHYAPLLDTSDTAAVQPGTPVAGEVKAV